MLEHASTARPTRTIPPLTVVHAPCGRLVLYSHARNLPRSGGTLARVMLTSAGNVLLIEEHTVSRRRTAAVLLERRALPPWLEHDLAADPGARLLWAVRESIQ